MNLENIDVELLDIANEAMGRVARQNVIYQESTANSSLLPLGDLIIDQLCVLEDQQHEDFGLASEIVRLGYYDQIGESYVTALQEVGDLNSALESIESESAASIEEKHKEAIELRNRFPNIQEEIDRVMLEQAFKDYPEAVQDLAVAKYKATINLQRVEELYERYGNVWPIPALINRGHFEAILDKFPDDKATSDGGKSCERNSPEYIEQMASAKLAGILSENSGRALTLDELGEQLYGDIVDAETRSKRISALISNFDLGKSSIIGDLLSLSGLVMQRGGRYRIVDGKRSGPKRVIFRAIEPEKIPDAELEYHVIHDNGDEQYSYVDWELVGKIAGRANLRLVS